MAEDAEPFVQVEFDVLFYSGAEEAAAPATAFAVGYWAADSAPGAEEEEVYVWVYLGSVRWGVWFAGGLTNLGHNSEVDVEMEI